MKADEYTRALLDELCVHANQKNVGGNTYKFDCTRCTQGMFVAAHAAAREEGRAAGYAEAIEKLIMFRFDDESDLTGEQAVAIYDGMGGHRGQVYLNVNHKWYCSPTLSREFETMEAARDALCAHIAADIRALAPADKEKP